MGQSADLSPRKRGQQIEALKWAQWHRHW